MATTTDRLYYYPDDPLPRKPKYKPDEQIVAIFRSKPWYVKEVTATRLPYPKDLGYWFDEMPGYPLFEHELKKAP